MKIAILQMSSVLTDTKSNLAKINAAAHTASSEGAQLLVCPELAITGYGAGDDLHAKALAADEK